MGIGDQGILSVGQSVEETTKSMLSQMVDEDTELISIYYGQDVLAEDAERLAETIGEKYPDADDGSSFRRSADLLLCCFRGIRRKSTV